MLGRVFAPFGLCVFAAFGLVIAGFGSRDRCLWTSDCCVWACDCCSVLYIGRFCTVLSCTVPYSARIYCIALGPIRQTHDFVISCVWRLRLVVLGDRCWLRTHSLAGRGRRARNLPARCLLTDDVRQTMQYGRPWIPGRSFQFTIDGSHYSQNPSGEEWDTLGQSSYAVLGPPTGRLCEECLDFRLSAGPFAESLCLACLHTRAIAAKWLDITAKLWGLRAMRSGEYGVARKFLLKITPSDSQE